MPARAGWFLGVLGLCGAAILAAAARPDAQSAYVGADACASCHQAKYDLWKSGRHSRMIQPASPASVVGDFGQGTITLRGSDFAVRQSGGAFFVTESALTGSPREHRVEYTLGSRRIQHYLTTIEDGKIVVLAPTWDVARREWIHNLDIVRPDEDDRRVLQQWNRSCVGCHVSQQEKGYDPATGAYATRWVDFGTSCERCHGPGRAHVDAAGAAAAIVRPTRLDPAASSMVCAQCHSMRTPIAPGFTPGADYYDYFQPVLESGPVAAHDPAYWADGRPRRFSNDAFGLWQSACFLRGGATCTTCHVDPHLPNVDDNPQLASGNNALCTSCHQAIGADVPSHTRHAAGSTGSSCVECHMPKTVVSLRATMRDHTIGVPAPENTVRHGIPNACTACHADRPASWAVQAMGEWWPGGRRAKLIEQADAFAGARAGRPAAEASLLSIAADAGRAPLTRANAIGHLAAYPSAAAGAAIVAATRADHPAMRAAAAGALAARTGDRAAAGAALLAALDDPARAVRVKALAAFVSLGGSNPGAADRPRFQRASREFADWARMNEDDGDLQRALGVVQLLNGDFDAAAAALQLARTLTPKAPSVTYLLALARIGQARSEDARALLRQVPESDPYFGNAQQTLRALDQEIRN
jgi:predicted CXXCH cytochrome family protein